MPGILLGFFFVILLGSGFAQMRFSGRVKINECFAAAGFSTFGLAVIMASTNGLLNKFYLIISLVVALIGAGWLLIKDE